MTEHRKEYKRKNRLKIKEQDRKYYLKNKKKINEKHKLYKLAHNDAEVARRVKRRDREVRCFSSGDKSITVHRLWHSAKKRAAKFNIPFDLTEQDIVIPEYCPIFKDMKLELGVGRARSNSPSIDKITPSLGYTKGNCWVISYQANAMKNSANIKQLHEFADAIKALPQFN